VQAAVAQAKTAAHPASRSAGRAAQGERIRPVSASPVAPVQPKRSPAPAVHPRLGIPAARAVVQAHPIVEVQISGLTHLRESDRGMSLAFGSDFAEVRYPERVTIDKGDIWDSRLGMNLAIWPQASHEWYRVVRYNGMTLLDRDVYLREGMFHEQDVAPATVLVVRFCDRNREETLWSPDSQNKRRARTDKNWRTEDITASAVLRRALAHMDGATADSPFVSVAEDEQSLLRFGYSGGLRDIMFGVEKPETQAPDIGLFRVPAASLITPELIRQHLESGRSAIGLARARMETECLYYGDDISRYLVAWRRNPYNRETFEAMMARQEAAQKERQQAEEERVVRQIASLASAPKSLFLQEVKKNWLAFSGIVAGFRVRASAVSWSGFDTLNASTPPMQMRPVFRALEESLQAHGALWREWLSLTDAYRR
jgi:hypothetical protein